MSRLSEYSKFDHIDDEEDIDSDDNEKSRSASTIATISQSGPLVRIYRKESTQGRFVYEHDGKTIYEWEQNLNEVIIYVTTPSVVKSSSDLTCQILPTHLRLGLTSLPAGRYYIDEPTWGTVNTAESTWCLEEEHTGSIVAAHGQKVICIYLQKANKGTAWRAALRSRLDPQLEIDEYQVEKIKEQLMLERWQEENPHMDFRDAKFNGSVPDPRTFMGGVNYE